MPSYVIPRRICLRRDTTAHWNAHPEFIPLLGEAIVYTDYSSVIDQEGNTVYIPNFKIGDGTTYCIDLPFITDAVSGAGGVAQHMANTDIHTNSLEKAVWNNKINCDINGEELIFNND